eukprot:4445389-Alexandrium_andersonii.AAC.1
MASLRSLADMLNRIEAGARWPPQLTQVACTYMAKKGLSAFDPLGFRGISILACVYRTWAKLRLRHAQAWVRSWQHPGLQSGVAG